MAAVPRLKTYSGWQRRCTTNALPISPRRLRDHRWYPYSFLAPIEENEPWLSSALAKVGSIVKQAVDCRPIAGAHLYLRLLPGRLPVEGVRGQKPCALWRVVALTGGLIGPPDADLHHPGNLAGMPALFSSGDPDPHVPWSRVLASAEQFTAMGAAVQTAALSGSSSHRPARRKSNPPASLSSRLSDWPVMRIKDDRVPQPAPGPAVGSRV